LLLFFKKEGLALPARRGRGRSRVQRNLAQAKTHPRGNGAKTAANCHGHRRELIEPALHHQDRGGDDAPGNHGRAKKTRRHQNTARACRVANSGPHDGWLGRQKKAVEHCKPLRAAPR
jgi:hypothetical protein